MYVADTLSTDTTYTDVYSFVHPTWRSTACRRSAGSSDAGERSEGVPVGGQ